MAEQVLHAQRCRVTWCAYDWQEQISGPGTWLADLLPRLTVRGVSNRVLLCVWDQPGPLALALTERQIPFSVIPMQGSTQQRIRMLLQSLAAEPTDIFVAHNVLPALLAAPIVRTAGVPTVAALHSDDRFYHAVIDVFQSGRARDAVTAMVAVSQQLFQQIQENGEGNTQGCYIPYGVSLQPRIAPRTQGRRLKVAYAGRLVQEQKRITDVVQAMLRLVHELDDCTALIIGDGPLRGEMQRLVLAEAADDKIQFTGRLSAENTRLKMLEADIILLLSDYEGLPIVLLEAMASGLVPVVSRMRSGVPELIHHGVNGLVVDDRGDSVVNAVRQLQNSPELRSRLSHEACSTIHQQFSADLCADRWAELLSMLAGARGCTFTASEIPAGFDLPTVHPDLQAEDPRADEGVTFSMRLKKLIRRTAQAVCGLKSEYP